MEGTLYEEVSSASYSENDISNSLKNGILYLEDPVDHVGYRPPTAVSRARWCRRADRAFPYSPDVDAALLRPD